MLQRVFHYIDFEERGLRAGLAAAQVADHVGGLQLAFVQQ